MNTPVSFEIAKLLKERGFKGDTYYDDRGWHSFVYYDIHSKELKPQRWFGDFRNIVKAPIIAEVVMWLYKTHGIWIWTERCNI